MDGQTTTSCVADAELTDNNPVNHALDEISDGLVLRGESVSAWRAGARGTYSQSEIDWFGSNWIAAVSASTGWICIL
jgi:hypothetical protein